MWSAAPNESAPSHLAPSASVDSVCTMGTVPGHTAAMSTAIQTSHSPGVARGLFCAQLLAGVLDPFAEATIARHLPAHLVHAVNHGRVVPPTEGLPDLHELHLQ